MPNRPRSIPTPPPPPPPFQFYPAYTFPLSPIHNTWAKLTASDLHGLQERPGFEGQNLYFYLNHPVKWVRLVGVVVALDVYPTRWIMVLDDGSGMTVEVVCGKVGGQTSTNGATALAEARCPGAGTQIGTTATGRSIDLTGVDVGSVVKVKGGVGTFRGEKQLVLERLSIVHSTTEEAATWAELAAFKEILNKPWVLSVMEQARARRKAEGRDRERERRARERRKRKKDELKKEARHVHKEKERRDPNSEGTAEERNSYRNEARVGGEPRRGQNKESTVTKVEVTRPVISGKFDALGL